MYRAVVFASCDNQLPAEIIDTSVQKVYAQLELPVKRQSKPAQLPPRCRCEAEHTNHIWHTDPHDHAVIGSPKRKLMAFTDDAPGVIMGFRYLQDKLSILTTEAFSPSLMDKQQS
jgi:hypothetical protein